MKKHLLLLVFFSASFFAFNQSINLSDNAPTLSVSNLNNEESPIYISGVDIDVQIVGDFATTTLEWTIYNPNNRVLEASLEFPLLQGQFVSRFALDLDGVFRDGVAIDKAKGQAVFESIIRQKIDPALLENTVGNNYRARVYPLPSKGSRRVLIRYDQELTSTKGKKQFLLPISYSQKLNSFNLKIRVEAESPTVTRSGLLSDLNFVKDGDGYVAKVSRKNSSVVDQLTVDIPSNNQDVIYTENDRSGETAFFAKIYPRIADQGIFYPKTIDLYWDNSNSRSNDKITEELNLLDNYFSNIKNVKVNLFTFNISETKGDKFDIKGGEWSALRKALEKQTNDGATQIGILDFTKSKSELVLLFTDGISNFGKSVLNKGNVPITVITTSKNANHTTLEYLAESTNGKYINLENKPKEQALNDLLKPYVSLISTKYSAKNISSLTVSFGVANPADEGFSITGKLLKPEASIKLNFGIGNKTIHTQSVDIKANEIKTDKNLITRIEAYKHLNKLAQEYEKNKDEISALGKQYGIVTPNISLIVLDRIEDYVEFEITPPAELLDEYNRLLAEKREEFKSDYEDRSNDLYYSYRDVIELWEGEKKHKGRQYFYSTPIYSSDYTNFYSTPIYSSDYTNFYSFKPKPIPDYSTEDIKGEVKFENDKLSGRLIDLGYGDGAIGVTVMNKTKNTGVITDIDGSFSLDVEKGDIIDFLYIGYDSQRITVGNSKENVVLRGYQALLSEMVVVAYGVSNSKQSTPPAPPVTPQNTPVLVEEVEEIEDGDHLLWDADATYMDILNDTPSEKLHRTYLKLEEDNLDRPSFYLDASTIFEKKGTKEELLLVLSNLAEMYLQDYKIQRVLAHRLKQLDYTDYAINLFEQVLILRPEEPQSYRDLALTYEKNGEYQKALDIFWQALQIDSDSRFSDIESILLVEMNHVISSAKYKGIKLKTDHIDKRLIKNLPVNLRVVLNWDTDNSDMDLYVTDPKGEECYYGNRETEIRGFMSDDYTGGYGPEVFMLKKAIKGEYKIEANYYGSREQTLIGPTSIYLYKLWKT